MRLETLGESGSRTRRTASSTVVTVKQTPACGSLAISAASRSTRGLRVCSTSAAGGCAAITSRQPRVSPRRRSSGV